MGKFDCVVVHYDEIGLKGKNKGHFEKLLMRNIGIKLRDLEPKVVKESGQLTIFFKDKADQGTVSDALSRVPGIAYFSFAMKCPLDIDELKKEAVKILSGIEFSSFRIDTRRHSKEYKLKSSEINAALGKAVVDALGKKVKLDNPDITLKAEISHKNAYLSCVSEQGVGGLPVDQRQKVVALLSGGFDSPVAAFMMMKRGCEVVLVHFRNKNQMAPFVEDKISDLARQLSKYQMRTVLHLVPFEELQNEIIMKVPADMRMLVYRKFMIRIASRIADSCKAKFLIIGDSLSQVSSQTIDNLEATYRGSGKHILSPLIGMNKREIMSIAERIGTHDISSRPYGDCCSYFLPKHPVLRADPKVLDEMESRFDAEKLTMKAIKDTEKEEF